MKQLLICMMALLAYTGMAKAHEMHVQTAAMGKKGVAQEVKVFFAEDPAKWEVLDGDEWKMIGNKIDLWVVNPHGKAEKLSLSPKDNNHYSAMFTPSENGVYQVIMANKNVGVLAFEGNPPFAPFFYAKALVKVGKVKGGTAAGTSGLSPIDYTLTADNKMVVKADNVGSCQINIHAPGAKEPVKATMDNNGVVNYTFKDKGTYHVDIMGMDKNKGELNGKPYESKITVFTSVITI